jgi:hypothetical protein
MLRWSVLFCRNYFRFSTRVRPHEYYCFRTYSMSKILNYRLKSRHGYSLCCAPPPPPQKKANFWQTKVTSILVINTGKCNQTCYSLQRNKHNSVHTQQNQTDSIPLFPARTFQHFALIWDNPSDIPAVQLVQLRCYEISLVARLFLS